MYVAAPIRDTSSGGSGEIIGAVSVGKPVQSFGQFVEAARRKTLELGATSVVAVLLLVVILSVWLVRPFGVIADYVRYVRAERSFSLPRLGRRALGAFGAAYDEMRDALAGRNYVADYVQTMTHEVKSPLSAIRGAAELLQEPMADADRARFVANIARETQRIQELVDRMMELTALESRRRLDRAEPVALRALAAELAASAAPAALARGLALELLPGDDDPVVAGDAFLLQRALANLVDNAIDFSPRGGRVTIEVVAHARSCDLIVRDQGPGIPGLRRRQGVREVLFARAAGDGEEEHRPRPVVRQGDRRAAPRPRDAEEPARRRRGRDALAAAQRPRLIGCALSARRWRASAAGRRGTARSARTSRRGCGQPRAARSVSRDGGSTPPGAAISPRIQRPCWATAIATLPHSAIVNGLPQRVVRSTLTVLGGIFQPALRLSWTRCGMPARLAATLALIARRAASALAV